MDGSGGEDVRFYMERTYRTGKYFPGIENHVVIIRTNKTTRSEIGYGQLNTWHVRQGGWVAL